MKPAMSPARPLSLRVATERWPIAGAFTISRGSKTQAEVVIAEVDDGLHRGRGECVPYGRYGETVERVAAPLAGLLVDAKEGGPAENLAENLAACAAAGVTLVEQPLPAEADAVLADIPHPIPVCADESVHDRASLKRLAGKYDAINLKLDKAGGLTEGLALAAEAARLGLGLMVGGMIPTSLALAPAMLTAQPARVVCH